MRELALALIGQPSRPGPTPAEQAVKAAQLENLRADLQRPSTVWNTAKQIGKEVVKVLLLQPSAPPRRKKD